MTHEEQAGQPTEVEYEDGHFRSPPPRLSSTQPVVLSPELKEKVLVALRKDSVPVPLAGASSTRHPPSIGLTEALSLISDRLMAMDAKLDNVATINALTNTKDELMAHFEDQIQKLQTQITALAAENDVLKKSFGLESKLLTATYVSFKRFTFSGFGSESPANRAAKITEALRSRNRYKFRSC